MDFFSNILGQGKGANPAINKGNVQFEAGNYTDAVKSFEKALRVDPENSVLMVSMGQALACLGRDGEAAEWLRKALEASPGDAEILRALGHI
ncbi:MAG: tetratricopeptide repeat protein, partial [Methanomicrobiales archaeon]|nr:tetratricopeptide repeat protein [Methanomicrobiales archaeon]